MTEPDHPFVVAALYKFTRLSELRAHQAALRRVLNDHAVRGTILLAEEGVNGTIAGDRGGIDAALGAIRALPGCADLEHKESFADEQPFLRLKVRLKKEIVTLGVAGVDPNDRVGTYVDPADWNALIGDPEVVLIDTRNDYEVAIGTFAGAIDPKTESFRDFPEWFRAFRAQSPARKVAMFCTGGIRCEKASSFLLQEGVEEVFHLKGGILKYLETVPADQSTWSGECFVFDGRVSVGHGLSLGSYDTCYACRRPLSAEMKMHQAYRPGVSCPQCIEEFDDEKRRSFEERHRQVQLARERGVAHLGDDAKRGA